MIVSMDKNTTFQFLFLSNLYTNLHLYIQNFVIFYNICYLSSQNIRLPQLPQAVTPIMESVTSKTPVTPIFRFFSVFCILYIFTLLFSKKRK